MSFLSWKAKIDQMEKKCQELNRTFIDEYVIEAKQLMSHLNPDANVGQGQFYCASVIICGSACSYCRHCEGSLLLN